MKGRLINSNHTRDKTASYTKNRGRIHHGFKAHIAIDTNGIIEDYRFDTAKVHDSQHIDDLTTDEQHSVFADSAYMSDDRKKALESRGVFCDIIQRCVRGQKELTTEQKWHNRLVAGFRAVVEHPFVWMKNTGEPAIGDCAGMKWTSHCMWLPITSNGALACRRRYYSGTGLR